MPGVFDLLSSPKLRERLQIALEIDAGGVDNGMNIEQRSVRVEQKGPRFQFAFPWLDNKSKKRRTSGCPCRWTSDSIACGGRGLREALPKAALMRCPPSQRRSPAPSAHPSQKALGPRVTTSSQELFAFGPQSLKAMFHCFQSIRSLRRPFASRPLANSAIAKLFRKFVSGEWLDH